MKRSAILFAFLLASSATGFIHAQCTEWPEITPETRPATRWWWMGSAVDRKNLTRNMETYAQAGLGTLEITPIYGVQGEEAREIPFLSPRWMQMLIHTQQEAARLGMQIDMNTGTGWPFGGPEVSQEDAASKLLTSTYTVEGGKPVVLKVQVNDRKDTPDARLERLMAFHENGFCLDLTAQVSGETLHWKAPKGKWKLIAAFCGKTRQKVKRAAPGGDGFVIDHFSARAVEHYLSRFDQAFAKSSARPPHHFFNDSYEVYKADWTPGLFDKFARRWGYRLEEYLPEFLSEGERTDKARRIISDYRETLSEMLQENFTRQWTEWAHRHHALTRNQAHGSPGNLIDLYATVDVPECEGFGLSDFHISGLRRDSLVRPNDSDLSMLKYASSAAHLTGKPYTSSETFTWLTEHFRTSLSQCKPDLDLMFLSGVNRIHFHGTTYSPAEAAWPGWKFYASVDMSPTNSIWRDAPALFQYITRCQSFLQSGKPDNDFLLYLPLYDLWHEQDGRLLMFDIHQMAKRAPRFIGTVHRIYEAGYDMDYISDRFIRQATCRDGKIITSEGTAYKALIIPGARLMPADVLQKLQELANQGATVLFLGAYPEDVPGWSDLTRRREAFRNSLDGIRKLEGIHVFRENDESRLLAHTTAQPEALKSLHGLQCIRRADADGFIYFISALQERDTEAWIPLAVQARSAMLYNPMNGTKGKACLRQRNGQTEVYLQVPSGASLLLKTFTQADIEAEAWPYYTPSTSIPVRTLSDANWGFRFVECAPVVESAPDSVRTGSWTDCPGKNIRHTMGTACYTLQFTLEHPEATAEWLLDLGDVRESARVRVNGTEAETLWAVPFRCLVGRYLRNGKNTLEVEVTNLPANRIAWMDRQEVPWRIFKDINMTKLGYKKGTYAHWEPMPSGLLGPVRLIPMERKELSVPIQKETNH